MLSWFTAWLEYWEPKPRTLAELQELAFRLTAERQADKNRADVEFPLIEVSKEEFVMLLKAQMVDFVFDGPPKKGSVPTFLGHVVSVKP